MDRLKQSRVGFLPNQWKGIPNRDAISWQGECWGASPDYEPDISIFQRGDNRFNHPIFNFD